MIEIIKALLLGIIEGITEFLPISSTGHLIVAEKLINFKDVGELFTVVIQFGAIAAVIWLYRKDLWSKFVGFFKRDKAALNFWLIMVIGTIPAGIIGLLFDKTVESISQPFYVALALIVGGVVLWYVDRKPIGRERREADLSVLTKKQALLVGLGQAVAIIPGVSRSAASIISGLSVGLSRTTATTFSFYLAIPVMILASGYKLLKHAGEISSISGGWAALFVGVVVSFITALAAIKWLLRYISRNNFRGFAVYRIIAGFVIMFLILGGVLINK